jgi:hypothetical protein
MTSTDTAAPAITCTTAAPMLLSRCVESWACACSRNRTETLVTPLPRLTVNSRGSGISSTLTNTSPWGTKAGHGSARSGNQVHDRFAAGFVFQGALIASFWLRRRRTRAISFCFSRIVCVMGRGIPYPAVSSQQQFHPASVAR